MSAIGIRVAPKEIFYTIIIDSDISHESIIVPRPLGDDIPRQLSFIRTTLHSIICEYDIHYAGIRTAEGNARTLDRFRLNLEGVIQELFSDSTITHYFTGTKSSIKSRLKINNKEINECIEGTSNIFNVENWDKINKSHRESFLAGMSALHSSGGDLN